PEEVVRAVRAMYERAAAELGPIRFEWVHDGNSAWIVQLHRGATATSGRVIFDGEARRYHRFRVAQGIEALRRLISEIGGRDEGIIPVGSVGVTSHLGDILRRASIPSHIEADEGAAVR